MHTLQLITDISAALSCPSGLPGAFQAALHGVLTASGYEQAIRDTMSCGGCTCSRSSFIGACIGAQVLQKSWPCDLFDHIVLAIKQNRLYVIKVQFFLCYLLNTYLSEQSIPIFHRMIMSYMHDRTTMQLLLQFCNGSNNVTLVFSGWTWGNPKFLEKQDFAIQYFVGSRKESCYSPAALNFLVCKVNKWIITGYNYVITQVLLSFAYRSSFVAVVILMRQLMNVLAWNVMKLKLDTFVLLNHNMACRNWHTMWH